MSEYCDFFLNQTCKVNVCNHNVNTQPLGAGAFGKVYQCDENKVIKIAKKDNLQGEYDYINYALKNWINPDKPNVNNNVLNKYNNRQFNDFFEYVVKMYPMTEYMNGREINDLKKTKLVMDKVELYNKTLDNNITLQLINGLVNAVDYLHAMCEYSHNDIKPDNIGYIKTEVKASLTHNNSEITINLNPNKDEIKLKLLDMGLSKPFIESHAEGTTQYMNILLFEDNTKYRYVNDMWAVGCTIYEMVAKDKMFKVEFPPQVLMILSSFGVNDLKYMLGHGSQLTPGIGEKNIKNLKESKTKFVNNIVHHGKNAQYIKDLIYGSMIKTLNMLQSGGYKKKRTLKEYSKKYKIKSLKNGRIRIIKNIH
jgi:serine/threonine protein kinase